jgi:hypothetical protein
MPQPKASGKVPVESSQKSHVAKGTREIDRIALNRAKTNIHG